MARQEDSKNKGRRTPRMRMAVFAAVALIFTPMPSVFAGNGLNVIGFGAESVSMGGADVAIAHDTTALNSNPAGLARIGGTTAELFGALAYGHDVRHQDGFGNDRNVSNRLIGLGGGGYARRIGEGPCVAGVGVFAQGGAGVVYKDIATAFGTRDEMSNLFRIAKLVPGAACRVTPALSFGASLGITYADIHQKVFPGTSFFNALNPPASFLGSELSGVNGTGVGARVGVQYDFAPGATVGATFSPQINLPLQGGRLVSNQTAFGRGNVTFRDARIDGLALPREVGVGVAFTPSAAWQVSLKLAWLNWARAARSSTLTVTQPDNPAAPAVLQQTSVLGWRDQRVIAIGVAYKLDERSTLRAGYNYGRNPSPPQNTNPLLAVIGQHHLGLGYSRRMEQGATFTAALEYQFSDNVTYTNPALPFGANARERANFPALHLMWSNHW